MLRHLFNNRYLFIFGLLAPFSRSDDNGTTEHDRISDLESAGIAERQAASEYLQPLAAMGLLRPVKAGFQMRYLVVTFLRILGK